MSYSELQELNNEINIEWASDHVSNDSLLQGPLKNCMSQNASFFKKYFIGSK